MALQIEAEIVPIRVNDDGVALVGKTHVPLETVVRAYHMGATPEQIVIQYPALFLSQVYQVIGYYLNHQEAVDVYIREQEAESERVRREIDARTDLTGIRDRLLARRQSSESDC